MKRLIKKKEKAEEVSSLQKFLCATSACTFGGRNTEILRADKLLRR